MLKEFHFASGMIAYEVKGSGPLLFLLHGFGGNHSDWESSSGLLEKHFTVVVPRLVHVFFPKKGKHSFSAQVDIVAAFIAEVRARFINVHKSLHPVSPDLERRHHGRSGVYLAGTSFGGALAWGVSIRYPKLIDRLVLVTTMPSNPASRVSNSSLKSFLSLARVPVLLPIILKTALGQLMLRQVETLFYAPWADRGAGTRLARITDRKLKLIFLMVQQFSWIAGKEDWTVWESSFSQLRSPTLFVTGSRDNLFKKSDMEWFRRQFAKSEVVEILGGGHLVMREFPDEVVQAMSEFLNSGVNELNGIQKTLDPFFSEDHREVQTSPAQTQRLKRPS